ncbi:MAG: T9SS type A sorting domain-containing protein [Calditrichaceae bacterium]
MENRDKVICGDPVLPDSARVHEYFKRIASESPSLYKQFELTVKLTYDIGEERVFNVLNLVNPDKIKFDQVTAVLKATNSGVNIWVDKNELLNNHVTDAVIQNIINGLTVSTPSESADPSSGIVEIEKDIFGNPPDIDKNNTVEFLLVDIKDGWDGEGSYIGGFFYSLDQLVNQTGSNKADMLYIDTYPGIFYENEYGSSYTTQNALATVAHEFQHLIQYNYDKDEADFINEGLSELASYVTGYGLRNPTPYLMDTGVSLNTWDNTSNDATLKHYAKVALWDYFLYEKYQSTFIRNLAQDPGNGITGISSALLKSGISEKFDQVLEEFFLTLVSNNPDVLPQYSFNKTDLQYLQAKPKKRADYYPVGFEIETKPYSLNLVSWTNGDTLKVDMNGAFFGDIYLNKSGMNQLTFLENVSGFPLIDPEFGTSHHTQTLSFVNNTEKTARLTLTGEAREKYYISTLEYGGEKPTFNISSENNINAIHFAAPYDSTLIKSIRFYNGASVPVRLHVYQQAIRAGQTPPSYTVTVPNTYAYEWVTIDIEDLQIYRNQNEFLDVGIEYFDDGSMGYEAVSNRAGYSFIKFPDQPFRILSDFKVGDNLTLSGIWMIEVDAAVPVYHRPQGDEATKITFISGYPNPYNRTAASAITFEYEYDGREPVKFDVFNVLGQRIYSYTDAALTGRLEWNGTDLNGVFVASGTYLIRLTAPGNAVFSKLVIIK